MLEKIFGKYSNDKRLVKKLLQGDEAAFENFYTEYFDKLYRFVLTRVDHQHHLAEDIVQSSLCKAIDKLSSFRAEASLLTWLCTFCRYELSAHFKGQEKRTTFIEDQPELLAHIESLATVLQQEPENNYLRKELNSVVHLTLDSLPERYATVVELKYIRGCSVKEIAKILDVTAKTVESLLSRARPVFEEVFMTLSGGSKLVSNNLTEVLSQSMEDK
jgi:RNA polymerase sigma-70 factor (ECF subfamily)